MKTCTYCTNLETFKALGRHHPACPIVRVEDDLVISMPLLAEWRQGYDDAARGHIAPDADATYRLGWSMRASRETPPTLRPALFLSLTGLLEHLRGMNLRTDSYGIQLATSLFFLDGDAEFARATIRYWTAFPHLRDPSEDETQRAKAEAILVNPTASDADRREALIVLNGEPDDAIRERVHDLLRTAEASGRLVWRGAREVTVDDVDTLLKRCGLRPTAPYHHVVATTTLFTAAVEAANGGALLAAA
ncbi:hypothetical protein HY635_03935 [Candidatus Uhrbacteria bacterium]|nr:hypothetical protein [Candidatus Uhrbacteria bacterium]